MIKKFVISLVLIIGLHNSINFAYPYQPGDAADIYAPTKAPELKEIKGENKIANPEAEIIG